MKFLSLFLVVVCLVGFSQADANDERLSRMIASLKKLIAKREEGVEKAPSPQNAEGGALKPAAGAPKAEGEEPAKEGPSSKEAEGDKSNSSESSEDTEEKPESENKDESAFTPEFLEKLKPVVFSMIDEHMKDILGPETFESHKHGKEKSEATEKEETNENEKTTAATADKEPEENKESETVQKRRMLIDLLLKMTQ